MKCAGYKYSSIVFKNTLTFFYPFNVERVFFFERKPFIPFPFIDRNQFSLLSIYYNEISFFIKRRYTKKNGKLNFCTRLAFETSTKMSCPEKQSNFFTGDQPVCRTFSRSAIFPEPDSAFTAERVSSELINPGLASEFDFIGKTFAFSEIPAGNTFKNRFDFRQ